MSNVLARNIVLQKQITEQMMDISIHLKAVLDNGDNVNAFSFFCLFISRYTINAITVAIALKYGFRKHVDNKK